MTAPDIPAGLRAAVDQEYAEAKAFMARTVAAAKSYLAAGLSPLDAWTLTAGDLRRGAAGADPRTELAFAHLVIAAAGVDLAQAPPEETSSAVEDK
jgi:hypothetical protein